MKKFLAISGIMLVLFASVQQNYTTGTPTDKDEGAMNSDVTTRHHTGTMLDNNKHTDDNTDADDNE